MKDFSTVCARDCYDTCSLIVSVDDAGQVCGIKGDPEHPLTRGFACPRAARDHHRLYENRIDAPFLRRGEKLEQTDWQTALDLVAERLSEVIEEYGSDSVLFLDYAGNTGLLTGAFPTRLWNVLGASQTDKALCSVSGHAGLALHYGDSYGLDTLDLPSRKLIAFWGFNAAVSAPHLWALARRARQTAGARIVVVDPRRSRSAADADLWLQPWPGTDVALIYGLISYLITAGCVDHEFLQQRTQGFEELEQEADNWNPERVERFTGVPWSRIEQLGEAYGHFKPSATMIGIGLQKNDHGAEQVRAVSLIPALLGLHRGFFYSNSHAFSVDEQLISGSRLTEKARRIVPQVATADMVRRGEFKYLYISCMNPALTLPNQRSFREGLCRKDLITVVHDTHWTKTAEYADVVLPAPTYLEKEDLVIPWSHPYVRYSPQVVAPVTDSRGEIWVMTEVARRLHLTEEWLFDDPWLAVKAALQEAFEEGAFDSLKSGAVLRLKSKPGHKHPTPSGKIEFCSSQAAALGHSPLPAQGALAVPAGDFVLLTSATTRYTGTQFQEVYGPIPAELTISPADAERLGVEDGDTVVLSNEHGQLKLKALVSDAVREGVVWSPRQSEDPHGEPQNCLTSSEPQELGAGPRFNSTRVTIHKA
jgi:anaerobic selenocysteine-containing dehydrogenase